MTSAKAATTPGDCSWKPQPTAWPAASGHEPATESHERGQDADQVESGLAAARA